MVARHQHNLSCAWDSLLAGKGSVGINTLTSLSFLPHFLLVLPFCLKLTGTLYKGELSDVVLTSQQHPGALSREKKGRVWKWMLSSPVSFQLPCQIQFFYPYSQTLNRLHAAGPSNYIINSNFYFFNMCYPQIFLHCTFI